MMITVNVNKIMEYYVVGLVKILRFYIFSVNPISCHTRLMIPFTDSGRPVRKLPSLYGRKSSPTPKFLGTAEAYFVCHIGPNFHISLIYAFIGCPLSVPKNIQSQNSKTTFKQNLTFTFLAVRANLKYPLCHEGPCTT